MGVGRLDSWSIAWAVYESPVGRHMAIRSNVPAGDLMENLARSRT
jgi:hypothetical protein